VLNENDARGVLPFAEPADIIAGVARAVAQIRSARLLAYPTETVYGLGCSLHADALNRLQALKPRSVGKPFLVIIADLASLDMLGVTLSPSAALLAARHWPGPLTLVLPGARPMHAAIRGAHGEVAVRWTSHEGAACIVRAWGAPITSTSANAPGLPPATTATEIVTQWGAEVAAGDLIVLDAGPSIASPPSTIVDCCDDRPRLVRPGSISADQLRQTVPDLVGAV
jgi:L-threonylcarbamoyladenylate synthase